MDRRIAKTRKAIFAAFDALIVKNDYAKISVQNIIDEADIGRSTFYEHFETKDDLLRAKCTDLFEHIFVPDGTEATHAFSRNSTFEEKIMHILYRKDALSSLSFWRVSEKAVAVKGKNDCRKFVKPGR